jgi:DNA invertase Pin-like site-specific DNA recombinase
MTYFLYARKSTDVEDKQMLSIESQLFELRALAKKEGLEIVTEFTEKRTAKKPGRPVFDEMMDRIRRGEARSILCWKLDRLSRNPFDDGMIRWLLQEATIQCITTSERSYYPPDNVMLMSMEFAMATQYSRDLGYNTSRGLREKARRGDFPAPAPVGYLNNPRTKSIMVDKRKAPLVLRAFETYAENKSRFEDIANYFYENGIRTRSRDGSSGGKRWSKDRVKKMLTNIFYYGDFQYGGEIYHGRHAPIVSKILFDKVRNVIEMRGRRQKAHKDPQALCGLLRCGNCGCSITAEAITKRQKNGNVHSYVYYRCTKKRGLCNEPYVREEVLTEQLSSLLSGFALPSNWAKELLSMAEKDEREAGRVAAASVQTLRVKVADLDERIGRLTDLYVEQDIERDAYLERKRSLMSERKSAEEQMARLERNAAAWLQPLQEWIQDAVSLDETAKSDDPTPKKSSLLKIFGSNLLLKNRSLVSTPTPPYASLREARLKFSENELSSYLVALYASILTHFTQNR